MMVSSNSMCIVLRKNKMCYITAIHIESFFPNVSVTA